MTSILLLAKLNFNLRGLESMLEKLKRLLPNVNVTGRASIGPYEVYGGLKRMTWVDGINSLLESGEHFMMWDFDDSDLNTIIDTMTALAEQYSLSPIHILQTGTGRYHAYCFTVLSWRHAFNLVWNTPGVDENYLKFAYMRGYFTLRFSAKSGRGHTLVAYIGSDIPPDIKPEKVKNFVVYKTKAG